MTDEHPWSGFIAVEARRAADGRLLLAGATTWKTLPVALIDTDGWSVIGRVEAVERDYSTDRTFHLIRAKGVSYRPLDAGTPIFANCVLDPARKQGDQLDIRGAVLRAVCVGQPAAWPECKIDG